MRCTSRTDDLDSSTSDSPKGVVVRRGRTDVNDRSVGRYLRDTAGVEAAVACVEMCLAIRSIFDMRCGRIVSAESRRFRAMLLYPCRRVQRVVIWCDADDSFVHRSGSGNAKWVTETWSAGRRRDRLRAGLGEILTARMRGSLGQISPLFS